MWLILGSLALLFWSMHEMEKERKEAREASERKYAQLVEEKEKLDELFEEEGRSEYYLFELAEWNRKREKWSDG